MRTIKTRKEARELFEKSGLSYKDIGHDDIFKLSLDIQHELDVHNESNKYFKMKLVKLTDKKFKWLTDNESDGIKHMFFEVNGSYFKKREAISFNSDGFIGFAGWASTKNEKPFIDAFVKWVDYLIYRKNIKPT